MIFTKFTPREWLRAWSSHPSRDNLTSGPLGPRRSVKNHVISDLKPCKYWVGTDSVPSRNYCWKKRPQIALLPSKWTPCIPRKTLMLSTVLTIIRAIAGASCPLRVEEHPDCMPQAPPSRSFYSISCDGTEYSTPITPFIDTAGRLTVPMTKESSRGKRPHSSPRGGQWGNIRGTEN